MQIMAGIRLTRRFSALGILVSLAAYTCTAEELPFEFYSLQTHDIESAIVGQTFHITVQLPIRLKDGSERFPVLYVTDAQTGARFEEDDLWMQWSGEIPRYITVNIGYPSWVEWQLRQRDFSPTDLGPIPGYSGGLVDLEPTLLEGTKGGGAAAFLGFIRKELKPFIDKNYPTIPTDDSYYGNSGGGRFGVYVLLNQPETFSRYILGSPALKWEDDFILKQAESFAASGRSVSAKLFMAAGSLESGSMIPDMLEIARLLEKVEGLEIKTLIFPDESHATAFRLSYSHGVRWAYQKPEIPFLKAYEMALKDQAQTDKN